MEPIYIPQLLNAPEQTVVLEVQDYLPDLDTLTPVQGQITITHRRNYLEVSAKGEGITTLTCDRCLQQYNHRLSVDVSELIWLDDTAAELEAQVLEREVALEDLVETLSPNGYFDPITWLYEQFCLAIPHRQLCDRACPGIELNQTSESLSQVVDHRWASLEALKRQLPS